MLGLTGFEVVGCALLVFVGATIQGVVGMGLGMLASPLLVAVDPSFVPGAMTIAVIPLSVGVVAADHAHIDRTGFWAATAGRIPGSVIGAAVVGVMSHTSLAFTLALAVYVAVIASVSGVRFSTSARSLAIAGLASGVGGTAVGIGGPPLALTYQRGDPRVVRSTIALIFLVGSITSAVSLVVGGTIGGREAKLGLFLMPPIVAGLVVSRTLNRYIDATRFRPLVLGLSVASATVLLVTELT